MVRCLSSCSLYWGLGPSRSAWEALTLLRRSLFSASSSPSRLRSLDNESDIVAFFSARNPTRLFIGLTRHIDHLRAHILLFRNFIDELGRVN